MTDTFMGAADEPWIPTLEWLEMKKTEPVVAVDYSKYGWSALVVPSDCPLVSARMDTLATRFLERYGNRRLNQETLERWQIRLQNRFDELVHVMNRAYGMYSDNATAFMGPEGTERTVSGTDTQSGTDSKKAGGTDGVKLSGTDKDTTTTSENIGTSGTDENTLSGTDSVQDSGTDSVVSTRKHSDTPDSSINESDSWAGTYDKDTDATTHGKKETTTYGKTDSRTVSSDTERTGAGTVITQYGKATALEYGRTDATTYGKKVASERTEIERVIGAAALASVNDSIDAYRDLDTLFVAGFENNFLNVWWYRWHASRSKKHTTTRT